MNKNSSNNIFKIGKTAKGTFELDHNQIQNTARRATHKNREFADHDFEKSTNLPVESISMILLQGQGLITYNIELVFLVLQVGLLSS